MSSKENQKYTDERTKQLLEIRKESEMLFDKQIRYIAAGAIALSVTLISSVSEITLNWMLLVAWILLIFTLLVNLLSYKASARAVDEDIINNYENSSDNKYTRRTRWLNWLSIISLITGLAFLVAFFYQIK